MTKTVLISFAGTSGLISKTAEQLHRLGYQVSLEAGYYHKSDGLLSRTLRWIPRCFSGRLERELSRRSSPQIPTASIRNHPWLEFPYVMIARTRLPGKVKHFVRTLQESAFDRLVAARLRREKPDLFIGHDDSCLNSLRAAKELGIPAILSQRIGHLAAFLRLQEEGGGQAHPNAQWRDKRPFQSHLPRTLAEVREADWVLAPSDYVRDTLVAQDVKPERIILLPYGVDTERFCPQPREDGGIFRILFAGGVGPRKGVHHLLEAVRRLSLDNLEVLLVGPMVAPDRFLEPYRDMIRHLPHVPFDQIHRIYQTSDIFVFPSLHEGSAFTVFEALASGLPVVTTPNAGSVVRDGEEGYIVPIRDVPALMDRILRLYENLDLRVAMGHRARLRAEGFTWNHYGKRLSGILDAILEPGSPPHR